MRSDGLSPPGGDSSLATAGAAVRASAWASRAVRADVVGPQRQLWEAAGYPWSVRLRAAPGVAPVGDAAVEDSA
jgi:hypothetical protein